MLNISTTNMILERISESRYFAITDFHIENTDAKFSLAFKMFPQYHFSIFDKRVTNRIKSPLSVFSENETVHFEKYLKISPSGLYAEEDKPITSESDISSALSEWLFALFQEISSEPRMRFVRELESKIEDLVKRVNSFEEVPFSADEIVDWKLKLDEFEKKIKADLEQKVEEGQKELKDQITLLHNEIVVLKATLAKTNKKNWFSFFAKKVGAWILKPENQKLVVDAAGELKKMIDSSSGN